MKNVTAMDAKTLAQDPSAHVRAVLAGKIALDFRQKHFSATESAVAIDIFRVLVKDSEIQIRKALAELLADCPDVPHDVILELANDEPDVALKVLELSSVLTEEDLIAIVESTCEVFKLCAIARRASISEELCGSLMETSNTVVLKLLFGNRGAAMSERQLMKAWDRITAHGSLMEALVHRGSLPITIAEKLYLAVSQELKTALTTQYKSLGGRIGKAVDDAHEWALLGLTPAVDRSAPDDDELVEDLVYELSARGRLTHSLLMRALCVGNLKVFESGIAQLAHVPRVNARILLLEGSGRGLQAIYKAAKMPEGFYDAVRVLLKISLEETELGTLRRSDFRKRVIERIHVGQYHKTVENMEYMLSIIGGKAIARSEVH
jgi:uncharacterized protein (DUF2336 family)